MNFNSTGSVYGNLVSVDANTLALRNGNEPQKFEVDNTWTDASNYESGIFQWFSNSLYIGTAFAGSGARQDMFLIGNSINLGTGSDGSTKWTVNGSGHFLAATDNAYTVGDRTHRPKSIEIGSDGVFLTSPGGTRYQFTVSDLGAPVFTAAP